MEEIKSLASSYGAENEFAVKNIIRIVLLFFKEDPQKMATTIEGSRSHLTEQVKALQWSQKQLFCSDLTFEQALELHQRIQEAYDLFDLLYFLPQIESQLV